MKVNWTKSAAVNKDYQSEMTKEADNHLLIEILVPINKQISATTSVEPSIATPSSEPVKYKFQSHSDFKPCFTIL